MSTLSLLVTAHVVIEVLVIIRVLLRPHREPASRIAWIAVIAALPFLGVLAYFLFGEVSIGRRRIARLRQVLERLPPMAGPAPGSEQNIQASVLPRFAHLFHTGRSISGFDPIGGNVGRLLPDSNATIDAMVADMDAAVDHVHLLFYIWLPDSNGLKVVEALKRAAARGVVCRVIADDLGSRILIRSEQWKAMRDAGVRVARALRVADPLPRPLRYRVDLRNHRKIVVIDGRITYCGSQNCADPEFHIKAKYAPWVDAVIRFEGPIARQNQQLFAGDWMTYGGDDIDALLREPIAAPRSGFAAQVIGTGPTVRHSAMPEIFETLIYSARRELIVSTPYYVPKESMQAALCSCAYRGVNTTIVLPARNDSWIVSGASRSYYRELIHAGVILYEYAGGLLHTKSMTVDGGVTLIGSANMDRRSFDLNYENNILFTDAELTAAVCARQLEYIARSRQVDEKTVASWSIPRRLWNNSLAMLGPLL